jgi:hypothetical protein
MVDLLHSKASEAEKRSKKTIRCGIKISFPEVIEWQKIYGDRLGYIAAKITKRNDALPGWNCFMT